MTSSITGAVAKREASSPAALIQRRSDDFTRVLPKHVVNSTWLRLAESAINKSSALQQAAANDQGALMRALMNCATLGHLPGSDKFYLVPVKGKIEGWESYKGILARILNSAKYRKVIAEVVYEGESFEFDPNNDERPKHKIDFAGRSKGGKPILSYAYGVHHDNTTTRVAIADPGYVAKVRGMSSGGRGTSTVWSDWDYEMYLKSAVKRLEAFVATSNEDLRAGGYGTTGPIDHPRAEPIEDADEGTVIDISGSHGEVIEGEVVEDHAA
ncbi:recombinase RecT [Rhodococcus qingshengii]|uniref:Recombinase RecT n=1 Tax=Rhodococcus qingshengii TaxID=334542 RepID=A0AAW6LS04_RHOSG|nr:recombinase RecT [Rhodococcus qingshengii]MDE8648160.1 recombinase RecT [Rhodococcus qingshengii]